MPKCFQFGLATALTGPDTIIHSSHGVGGVDPFPVNPGALQVVSTSADDAPGQGGCEQVALRGLRFENGKYIETNVLVILDGLTPVDVVEWPDAFRCYYGEAIESTSPGGTNEGDIEITIDGIQVNRISAGLGVSETATFSLGTHQRGTFEAAFAAVIAILGPTPSATVRSFRKRFGGPWVAVGPPIALISPEIGSQGFTVEGTGPGLLPMTDIKIECTEFIGTSATITASFEIGCIDLIKEP